MDKMVVFNDDIIYRRMAAEQLDLYPFNDILEINDLTEEDVLAILIEHGHIIVPTDDEDSLWDTIEKLELQDDYET